MAKISAAVDFAKTVTAPGRQCTACGAQRGRLFYEVSGVPTNQVRLMPTREQALAGREGELRLVVCDACGFIWNSAFRPELVSYFDDYESTQAFSPTFNRYQERLARQLIERHGLAGKHVFEIGCGQGEFVELLAALGVGHATGFDPALRRVATTGNLTLVKDWYSEAYAERRPDFVATKMTMEHIPDPARFLAMLRRTIGDRPEVEIFAMVPDAQPILEKRAFWDIYHEHCAYYTRGSLARAFRHAGFDPIELFTDFGGHYCAVLARPGTGASARLADEETPAALGALVDDFAADVVRRHQGWQRWLREEQAKGRRSAMWGGGSKGVAFLTTLGIEGEVGAVVDINPRKRGTFMPGSGHRIETPDHLQVFRPDNVIIMSPIYVEEIGHALAAMGLAPRVLSIEADMG